jgi:hypothetical protein
MYVSTCAAQADHLLYLIDSGDGDDDGDSDGHAIVSNTTALQVECTP